jgi:hypothetical protein
MSQNYTLFTKKFTVSESSSLFEPIYHNGYIYILIQDLISQTHTTNLVLYKYDNEYNFIDKKTIKILNSPSTYGFIGFTVLDGFISIYYYTSDGVYMGINSISKVLIDTNLIVIQDSILNTYALSNVLLIGKNKNLNNRNRYYSEVLSVGKFECYLIMANNNSLKCYCIYENEPVKEVTIDIGIAASSYVNTVSACGSSYSLDYPVIAYNVIRSSLYEIHIQSGNVDNIIDTVDAYILHYIFYYDNKYYLLTIGTPKSTNWSNRYKIVLTLYSIDATGGSFFINKKHTTTFDDAFPGMTTSPLKVDVALSENNAAIYILALGSNNSPMYSIHLKNNDIDKDFEAEYINVGSGLFSLDSNPNMGILYKDKIPTDILVMAQDYSPATSVSGYILTNTKNDNTPYDGNNPPIVNPSVPTAPGNPFDPNSPYPNNPNYNWINDGISSSDQPYNGRYETNTNKTLITFKAPTPTTGDGSDPLWKLHFKVTVLEQYDEHDNELNELIEYSSVNTIDNPELFKVNNQDFPVEGLPSSLYGSKIITMVEVGPHDKVKIQVSVGAESYLT